MTSTAPAQTPTDDSAPDPTTRLPRICNGPNLVTGARTVAAVVLGSLGLAEGRWELLAVAYAAYWVGDVVDGWLARRWEQETRVGAVLDIVCDRLCTVLLAAGLVAVAPSTAPVVVVFLLSFAAVDTMLSLAFLCWDLLGPNDFWRVDLLVWRLNWSPVAKALNTAGVVGAIALGAQGVALAAAALVLAVKVWSAARLVRLLS